MTHRTDNDRRTISPRLRNALVADLVMEARDQAVADEYLLEHQSDEYDWTWNLARQLGIRDKWAEGLHDTLMFLLAELDEAVRSWPPALDVKAVARLATQHLSPVEVYTMLLAGPSVWRQQQLRVAECRVDKVSDHLRPILERVVASTLQGLVERWVSWDVPALKQRWREAREREAAERVRIEAEIRGPRVVPSRASGKEREIKLAGSYQPPGRS